VHGINAAASSYELRKQFEALSDTFRVYAVDLLGYGLSDRPDTDYSAKLYVDLLIDFVREEIREAVYVIASSLSAAYIIQAAHRVPDQFQKLALICPTGIEKLVEPPGSIQQAVYRFVRSPIIGTAFFNLLVSRASLGWYLKRSGYFDSSLVTDAMVTDYYATSHQPGAKWAPAAFISGQLNLRIRDAFQQLTQPLFIFWGQQAAFTPVENIQAFRRLQPNARIRVFDKARLLPHDEHADEFNTLVRGWFNDGLK